MDAPQQFDPKLLNLSVEKQIENAVAAERERCAELLTVLQAVLADIAEYERVNNLAPNPGRPYCWDSVTRAHAAIRKGE
jgi:hypothetical protein